MAKSQLILLKDKLKKNRRNRKISSILAFSLIFVGLVMINQYWINLLAYIIWVLVGGAFYQILKRYYDMKEKQLLLQIEKLRSWKGYNEH